MQDLDEELLGGFEVDFDIGDLLNYGSRRKSAQFSTRNREAQIEIEGLRVEDGENMEERLKEDDLDNLLKNASGRKSVEEVQEENGDNPLLEDDGLCDLLMNGSQRKFTQVSTSNCEEIQGLREENRENEEEIVYERLVEEDEEAQKCTLRSLNEENAQPKNKQHFAGFEEQMQFRKKARITDDHVESVALDMGWDVDLSMVNLNMRRRSGSPMSSQEPVADECFKANQKLSYMIPGPAVAVQMGISSNKNDIEDLRMDFESDVCDNPDFKSRAWLRALQYFKIREVDPVKYSQRDSTISHIKSTSVDRVSELVAVIKTCTPNGCGDAFVTLKDPTGTINGTIHGRVLAETEFGRDIVPEAVILLCKVSVFRPSLRAQYLNITMNNVVQVFRNELGSD